MAATAIAVSSNREADKVQAIYRRVQQSYNLIMMQLKVDKGMPPRSVESLIAKGFIRIEYNEQGRALCDYGAREEVGWIEIDLRCSN